MASPHALRWLGRVGFGCVLMVVLSPGAGSAEAGQFAFDTIALTGTDGPLGPGLGPGVQFTRFLTPSINTKGVIAFGADLTDQTSGSDGVWLVNNDGKSQPVALLDTDGQSGPNLGAGTSFNRLTTSLALGVPAVSLVPNINDDAEVAFFGGVDGNTFGYGLWKTSNDNPVALALTNTSGPLGPNLGDGHTFSNIKVPAFNANSQLVFVGFLIGSGNSSTDVGGIWLVDGGNPRAAALADTDGLLGPGLGTGFTFESLGRPLLNTNGIVVFSAPLNGPGISNANNGGVWTVKNGESPAAIVREGNDGMLGPGLGPGISFDRVGVADINDQGEILIGGRLKGSGINSSNRDGIWRFRDAQSMEFVARSGTDGPLGPGLGPGVTFSDLGQSWFLPNSNFVFQATLEGPPIEENIGIWITQDDRNIPVALIGTDGPLGPGLGPGISFIEINDDLVTNANGDIVFFARITENLNDGLNNHGIWTFVDGQLKLLLRSGDLFDVDPTANEDLRTIFSFIRFTEGSGGQDGLPRALNDDGLLALQIDFDDGSSGIFTVQIPEPASVALLSVGVLTLLRRQYVRSPGRAGG